MRFGSRAKWMIGSLVAVAWIASLFTSSAPEGSTFSTGPKGTQALFELLERLNYHPKRWRLPYTRLEQEGQRGALVVVAPPESAGHAALKRWVEAGNILLYFGAAGRERDPLFTFFGVTTDRDVSSAGVLHSVIDHASSFSYPSEASSVYKASDSKTGYFRQFEGFVPVRGTAGRPTALFGRVGQGEVWLFNDDRIVANEFIDRLENLQVVLSMAGKAETILFDEFHHGFIAEVATESARMRLVGLGAGAVYFVLLVLFAVISRSIRFGCPMPLLETVPAASTEFATALGALYANRAVLEALDFYKASWHRRLARSLGATERASTTDLLDLATARGAITREIALVCSRAVATLLSRQEIGASDREGALKTMESVLSSVSARSSLTVEGRKKLIANGSENG